MFRKKKRFKRIKKLLMIDALKTQSKAIASIVKSLFSVKSSSTTVDYEDLARMNIDQGKLILISRKLRLIYQGCLAVAGMIFVYCVWLWWHELYWLSVVAFSAVILSLAQGFKHHFWLSQIKQKRFGLSFKDWFLGFKHQQEKNND